MGAFKEADSESTMSSCVSDSSSGTVNYESLWALREGAFTGGLCDVVRGDERRSSEAAASLGPSLVSIQALCPTDN